MTQPSPKKIQHRTFRGVVVAQKADKTIVVAVTQTKLNAKYQKRVTSTKRYAVHDELNAFHVNDKVSFVECRPISRTKRWRVITPTSKV